MKSNRHSIDNKTIWVTGHNGMVGSAIYRQLKEKNCSVIIAARSELDLRNQSAVDDFVRTERPDLIFLVAATVGGIHANQTRPAEFIYDNLMIESNVINSAYKHGSDKLLFLGSSCIYPKFAEQPITEDALLTGPLEPTNEPYAIAKIAGIKLCQAYTKQYGCNFISAMPTNLYGPNDNYHPTHSHVIPGLIRRIHEAKTNNVSEVEIWGSGKPRREFLFVEDLAKACIFLMENYTGNGVVNVGTGKDISIQELAETIVDIVGYSGELVFNTDMPDGTPRKLLNVDQINNLGWSAETSLYQGLQESYKWFNDNVV
jgi:GDP-L-fucose synthase